MYHPLYTIGYSGWTLDDLSGEIVERLDAMLIDIRMQPWSRRPEWQKRSLLDHFGAGRYLHDPRLGNSNYNNDKPIQLAAPDKAVGAIKAMLTKWPIVLMCGCRDWHTCHRTVAAEYLAEQLGGLEIVHLEPPHTRKEAV